MAEKATEDVLAILESQGISDISEEEFDSSSDQETHQGSKVGNSLANEEESFVISKVRRKEQEEHSGSDADSSLIPGRSLSWKGRIDSPRSREKCKDLSVRRRSSFSSIGFSSPRHHLGKSCRQIKHKETRFGYFAYLTLICVCIIHTKLVCLIYACMDLGELFNVYVLIIRKRAHCRDPQCGPKKRTLYFFTFTFMYHSLKINQ